MHNGERFIHRALNSVAHQGNFKEMELIIVDDPSTDKTLEIVAKFAPGKPNVSWHRNVVNKGLASSSNVALSKARGRYILRLDADDFFVDDTALSESYFTRPRIESRSCLFRQLPWWVRRDSKGK
ncbi:MAG: glycosyltransferase family 2 protein [Nannocystis sp.]|nr:glycosyltransferase family 2 protein [Nannocystis sp.]